MEALDAHLRREGLLSSTRRKYQEIVRVAFREGVDPSSGPQLVAWANRRLSPNMPIGTLLPIRAAINSYLVGVLGYSSEETRKVLPKARGRQGEERASLSENQLGTYYHAVREVPDPAQTVLLLLPATGLRISEACSLRRHSLRWREGIVGIHLVGQGKGGMTRFVPLRKAGLTALHGYLERHQLDLGEVLKKKVRDDWLFSGYSGTAITPHAVRIYTRKIADAYPELVGLSPHLLRHTFASMSLRRGMNLRDLQEVLGHKNLQTTQRYLHPSTLDLALGMDGLDAFLQGLVPPGEQ